MTQYQRIRDACIGHWLADCGVVLEVGLTEAHRTALAEELLNELPANCGPVGAIGRSVTYVVNPATGGHVTIAPAPAGDEYTTLRIPLIPGTLGTPKEVH